MLLFGVDAFATRPFAGNPAAVCLLESGVDTAWMQQLAGELNQPATAFVWHEQDHYELRWFTPTQQLPLCGHATLAAAHVLYETGEVAHTQVINFHTCSGLLPVRWAEDKIWIGLAPAHVHEAPAPEGVCDALGVSHAVWFGRNDYEYVVEVDAPAQVEQAQPDFDLIRSLPVTRVILTAAGGTGVDFTSRVFVPAIGLNEDQVTGSAHAVLGPLWARRLGDGSHSSLAAVQASARRGEVAVNVGADQVQIGGSAVLVSRGELLITSAQRCETAAR